MTEVLEKPDTITTTDEGDHDRFSHYVDKADWFEGYTNGSVITALCGKQWQPGRDPKKYPVCPDCQEVINAIPE